MSSEGDSAAAAWKLSTLICRTNKEAGELICILFSVWGRLNLQSYGTENCNLYAHTPGEALAIHVTLASLTCSCQKHTFTLEVIYSPQFELFPPGYKKLFLPGCKKWLWLNVWPLLLLSQVSFHALFVVAGGQDSANYISATLCLSGRFLQEGSRRRLEGKRKDVLYPACVSFLLLQ